MKKPSRMRTGNITVMKESSAVENYSISSEDIDTLSSKLPGGYLVSARYNRRIVKPQSVKFAIPELDFKNNQLDLNCFETDSDNINNFKALSTSRNALSEFDNDVDVNDVTDGVRDNRRMSAPELPPIKKSGLLTNGHTRSNTFHNYKFNVDPKYSKRKSIHSDSSLQGYVLNNQSRTSSSSSQKSRGRVLSAGADRRTNRQVITADLPPTNPKPVKIESPAMRNGPVTSAMLRSGTTVERHNKKGSVKDMVTPTRKMHSSTSETQLSTKVGSTNGYIKRINSDKSITDSNKKMSKNHQNNTKTTANKARTSAQINNVNGLRKYSSTLGLDTKDDHMSEESVTDHVDRFDDSDSDGEKGKRVLQWIIGVNEMAEPPEEPRIEHHDEPPQRDTAIRIVYNGDT